MTQILTSSFQLPENTKGFISGCIAGFVQVLVMQPFQIIKVRQINEGPGSVKYHGFINSFKTIFREEGPLAFYKGTKSPLIAYGFQVSLQFGFNRFFRRIISDLNGRQTVYTLLTASIFTGIPSALMITPADHLRILMQKQVRAQHQRYNGEFSAARDIIKKAGIRGLYLGFGCTLLREMCALGVYFTCYEIIKKWMWHDPKGSWKQKLKVMLAGGVAGLASWILPYPVDFVKTRIQSQDLQNKTYRNSFHCFRQHVNKHGYRIFTRGLLTVSLRAIPVSAMGFLAQEEVSFLLKRDTITMQWL